MAKDRDMHLMSLYRLIERAFGTAALGYQLHKAEDLKIEGQNFAKTAEKFIINESSYCASRRRYAQTYFMR